MSKISYNASMGCADLNNFIRPTSKDAYKGLIESGILGSQCLKLFNLYKEHPDGLTDVEASRLMGEDASTLSARRNDITKKYGSHVIVSRGVRNNGAGRRKGLVWVINPFLEVR